MLVGYARVSTEEQNLDMQLDALGQAGCEKLFRDEMSGVKIERPGLNEVLAFVRPGDTLVVWRLVRLRRSLKDLIARVEELHAWGVVFLVCTSPSTQAVPAANSSFISSRHWPSLSET